MTLNLEINSNINKTRELSFKDRDDFIEIVPALSFGKIGNILVTDVPAELEYEVSKYVFNHAEIYEIKVQNVGLLNKLEGIE